MHRSIINFRQFVITGLLLSTGLLLILIEFALLSYHSSAYQFEMNTVFQQFHVQIKHLEGHRAHRSRGKSRDVKKMQGETEGTMKISASRASKRAPT